MRREEVRREGGGEARGRTKGAGREEAGRKGVREEGGGRGSRDEGWRWRMEERMREGGRRDEER